MNFPRNEVPPWLDFASYAECVVVSWVPQVMFTYELDRRLRAQELPVVANVLDPGIVDTELQRYLPAKAYC